MAKPRKNPAATKRKRPSDEDTLTVPAVLSSHGNRGSSPQELEQIIGRETEPIGRSNARAHNVWIPRFLMALERSPNWSMAARVAGVGHSTPYMRAAADPVFAKAAAEAESRALDLIEAAAYKSAVYGDLEPVFHEGIKVGEIVKYSHPAREMLLRAGRPGKYREKVPPPGTGSTQVNILVQITPERMVALQDRMRAKTERLLPHDC